MNWDPFIPIAVLFASPPGHALPQSAIPETGVTQGIAQAANYSTGPRTPSGRGVMLLGSDPYRLETLRLLVEDATRLAGALALPEELPIRETNLLAAFVVAPRIAAQIGAVGAITTKVYTYSAAKDNKLCYVEAANQEENRHRWLTQYSWPIDLLDTNAPYRIATGWLAAASIDVDALNRDCLLHIRPSLFSGPRHGRFSPLYWVYWTRQPGSPGSVACVELFVPTRTLVQMRVEDPKYNLRQPLRSTNIYRPLAPARS